MTTAPLLAAWAFLAAGAPDAPAAPPPVENLIGDVTTVPSSDRRVTVRTEKGAVVVLVADDDTVLLRSRPGSKSLADASPVHLEEIAVGDRVLARGTVSSDRSTFAARRIVVMTKTDIEARRRQEKEDWRRRGLSGVVAGLDSRTREITVRVRSSGAPETVAVPTEGRPVVFRRYPPDSVRFSDTRPSSFDELAVGDEVRLLGERDEGGARYLPEQVVSGTFRIARGLVKSVDADHGRLALEETEGRSAPLTVTVGADTLMRRLPPGFGMRSAGAGAEGAPSSPRRGSVDDVLESLPAIALADVKPGDTIAVLGTKGADPARLAAIKLVAGLPGSAAAAAGRGRRGGVGVDLGVPPGVLDLGGDVPW